jgi:hypothetical protein
MQVDLDYNSAYRLTPTINTIFPRLHYTAFYTFFGLSIAFLNYF